jgi:hypothetical protein
MRVQQLDAPAHGVPSSPHPPDGLTHRPGVAVAVVELLEHIPLQQSWFR